MTERNHARVVLPDDVAHGSRSAYRNYGCRCDECRGQQAAAQRAYIGRVEGRTVQPRRTAPKVSDWRSLVVANDDGCLVWQHTIDRNGYARLGGRWAHRAVYEYEVGPISDGHELDHLCVNPPCVNPSHLDPVTRAEHAARTMRRLGKDELHQSAAYMRTMRLTYREIAEALQYGCKGSAAAAVHAAVRKGLIDPDDLPQWEPLGVDDCQDMVELRAMGVPVNDLAEWYDIHPATASRISRGKRTGSEVA